MAHEKTWQFADNVVFGDISAAKNQAAWHLWNTGRGILGRLAMTDEAGAAIATPAGVWTLAQCCDSVTVKTDGTDLLFGPAFTIGQWVFSASAHSWATFYHALLGIWFTIDLNSATVTNVLPVIHYAAPTGGTTTARPTSTSDVALQSAGFMDTTFGATRKSHLRLATDGSFISMHSKDGTGKVVGDILVYKMVDLATADPYPVFLACEYVAAGIWRSGNSSPFSALVGYKDANGTVLTTSVGGLGPCIDNANLWLNAVASAIDRSGKIPRWTLRISNNSAGAFIKGRMQDMKLCPPGTDDTAVIPGTGQVTDLRIGGITIPGNGLLSL